MLIRISGGRLPKLIAFGILDAVRRERSGKAKEWVDCVKSDVRAFGNTGVWKATALEAWLWTKAVTEWGPRLMAAWRKEEGAASNRHENREANDARKLLSYTET